MTVKNFYTVKDVAGIFGVGTASVRRWANQGKLKVVLTPGGHRRIRNSDFRSFEKKYAQPVQTMDFI
jgi:excisionase family DNA binding protein